MRPQCAALVGDASLVELPMVASPFASYGPPCGGNARTAAKVAEPDVATRATKSMATITFLIIVDVDDITSGVHSPSFGSLELFFFGGGGCDVLQLPN
jgi:hypothetical protein